MFRTELTYDQTTLTISHVLIFRSELQALGDLKHKGEVTISSA